MGIVKNVLLSGFFASVASLSQAAVVDFNDVAAGTSGNFKTGGFDFKLTGLSAAVTNSSQYCLPNCPYNGSMLVLAPLGNDGLGVSGALTMSKSDGETFSLTSFEGTGSFNFNGPGYVNSYFPKQIDVVGKVLGGDTVVQSFAINTSAVNDYLPLLPYSFNSGFKNLTSVIFTSSGSAYPVFNGFTIDNIYVSAVPEPESYAMMLAGLGLLGVMLRRRQRTV